MIPPVGKSGPLMMASRAARRRSSGSSIIAMMRVDDLAEMVRRDVRGHADRDTRRAVDEQVREPRGKNGRLPPRLVVVRLEVDRVGLDVAEHLRRHPCQPALGVPHRRPAGRRRCCRSCPGRRRAGSASRRLRHADERVVDRLVAVRVVRAHHVADHARALEPGRFGCSPASFIAIEHAPVHGLEPVADVRERPGDDHAHRVVEEARAHLLLELARLDAARAESAGVELRHGSALLPLWWSEPM